MTGANLAIVLGAGLGLAAALGARRGVLAVVGILLVALLAVLTRWEPSVLRASVMAAFGLAGLAAGRAPGARRALCLAVTVLLLADPALLWALGFQLSAVATAGVLWLGPRLAAALPGRLPAVARTAAGATLGAQAAALPLVTTATGALPLAALPANLLALPLAGPAMLLGTVAAALAAVAPWPAALACRLAEPFLAALLAVARFAAGLPGATVHLDGPARLAPAVLVAVLLGTLRPRRRAPPRRVGGSR